MTRRVAANWSELPNLTFNHSGLGTCEAMCLLQLLDEKVNLGPIQMFPVGFS
jgi:hypothetical protein